MVLALAGLSTTTTFIRDGRSDDGAATGREGRESGGAPMPLSTARLNGGGVRGSKTQLRGAFGGLGIDLGGGRQVGAALGLAAGIQFGQAPGLQGPERS